MKDQISDVEWCPEYFRQKTHAHITEINGLN